MAVSLGSSWRIEPAAELRGWRTWLARLRALLVQAGEGGDRQAHLAAHLEQRRGTVHAQRDGPDGAQVLGDLLPDLAVAPRGAAGEHPVLVDSEMASPSTLGSVTKRISPQLGALALEVALAAHHPRLHLLLVAALASGAWAGDGAPARTCPAAALPRAALGSRGAELRVLGLQVPQLVQQRVVLGVGDVRVVEDVVAVVVALELVRSSAARTGRSVLPAQAETQCSSQHSLSSNSLAAGRMSGPGRSR